MTAYTYPLADLFGTMLGIFVFLIWFWLLVIIFGDILVYLIARGGKMHERAEQAAQQQQEAFDNYVKQTAGGSSSVDQLAKLADLKASGAITDAEFEAQKAKLLS